MLTEAEQRARNDMLAYIKRLETAHERYEKLRKLNPRQYSDLWCRCLNGDYHFDELVDELPK
jgi:hypothetical protein